MTDEEAFVRESRDHLRELTNALLAVEEGPDPDEIDRAFRTAHTLKGNAGMADFDDIERLAHALEDLLDAVRSGELPPDAETTDRALDVVDDLEAMVEEVDSEGTTTTDPTDRIDAVRESVESRRDPDRSWQPGADEEPTPDATPAPTAESRVAGTEPTSGEDDELTAEEALAAVDEFDDLDALVEDVEDEGLPELDGAGRIDEFIDEGADPAADDEPETEPAEPADTGGFQFGRLKEETERADIDELDSELEDVEFGEYDDEDDMSVQELLELDDIEESSPSEETADAPEPGPDEMDLDEPAEPGKTDDPGVPTSPPTDLPGAAGPAEPTSPDADEPTSSVGAATDSEVAEALSERPNEPGEVAPPSETGTGTRDEAETGAPGAAAETGDEPQAGGEAETAAETESVAGGDPDTVAGTGPAPEVESAAPPETEGTGTVDPSPAAGDPDPLDDLDLDEFAPEPDDDEAVRFERDSDIAEFESRFGDQFRTEEESEVLTVQRLDERVPWLDDPAPADRSESSGATESVTVDVSTADELLEEVQELEIVRGRLARTREDEAVDDLSTVARRLRRTVLDVRLMPISTVTEELPRVVRDAAREGDKQVDFETDGADVTLDRRIVSALRDPLVHVVRNAVDHGIESPDVRERAGKPPTGTVELSADRSGDRVVVEVSDDGRGIDTDAVRQRAVDEGLVDAATAEAMDDDAVNELLFHPGFSTADETTTVSGRGVGMDVVARVAEDLGGSVEVESRTGEGTTLRMELPVTTAVTEVLFVRSGDERYAVPVEAVERITPVEGVESVDGTETVPAPEGIGDASGDPGSTDDPGATGDADSTGDEDDTETPTAERVPLIRLREALGTGSRSPDDRGEGAVVHVRRESGVAGIRCDRLEDLREVVVTPFEGVLSGVPGVAGVTVLGDGQLANVLDVETL